VRLALVGRWDLLACLATMGSLVYLVLVANLVHLDQLAHQGQWEQLGSKANSASLARQGQ